MAEHRPFPPSPRRRALARRAGLHAASAALTGAVAAAAALVALAALGGTLADRLGAAIAAACRGRAVLIPGALAEAVLGAALPLAAAAAVAAVIAHLAQTRGAWLPRRRIAGAPVLDSGPVPRARRTAFDLAGAVVIGGATLAWLWRSAPDVAALTALDPAAALLAGGAALLASVAVALIVAWTVLGVLDALLRHAGLARALAMTAREKRDDERVAGSDPRWPRWRARARALPAGAAVAGSSLLLLGDDTAIAVAWDPLRRPVPVRTATGRAARATQLLGLARRHRLPVHRDAALAAALVDGDGPIPEQHWPRLAAVIAALRGRGA
jgi:flagellar biosynthesis protein FlhB